MASLLGLANSLITVKRSLLLCALALILSWMAVFFVVDEVVVCGEVGFEGCVVCHGLAVPPSSLKPSVGASGLLQGGGKTSWLSRRVVCPRVS